MIINQNNKDLLKGKVKRGFNQTPEELKEKLTNQKNNIEEKNNEVKIIDDYYKLKKARNELKRF